MLGGLGRAMQFSVMFRALDQFTGPVSRMAAQTRGLQDAMNRAQRTRALAGDFAKVSAASAGLAAGVSALVATIVGDGALEDALAAAQTVWTPVNESMDDSISRLADSAYKWSSVHKQSALEFVQAAYQMGSAGLNAEQAIAGTRAALGLATAAFGTPTEAANLLAVAYNTLGDKAAPVASEMGRIADVLARTQQAFQISDLNQLGEGLKYAIPSAQSARQSLEDVAATVGLLNTMGLQGSMAGTAYATLVGNLGRAGKQLGLYWPTMANGAVDVAGAIAVLRSTFGDLTEASAETQDRLRSAFGEEGFRALMLLSNATGQWKAGLDALAESTGTVEKTMAILEATPNARWQILKNQFDNTVDVLGDQLQPAVDRVQGSLLRAAETVERWVRANPDMVAWAAQALTWTIAIFAGVSAVSGLVSVLLWWWATWAKVYAIGKVLTTFLVGRFATAVAAAGTAIWSAFVFTGRAAWAGLRNIGIAALALTKRLWVLAAGAIKAGLAFLATPVGWLTAALAGLAGTIYYVANAWEHLTGQTNEMTVVAPDMVEAIKTNTALREHFIDKALAGNGGARAILNKAMSDTFDPDFWNAIDREKRAQNQADVLRSRGLAPNKHLTFDPTSKDMLQSDLLAQAKSLGLGDAMPSLSAAPAEFDDVDSDGRWEGPELAPNSPLALPPAPPRGSLSPGDPLPDVAAKGAVNVGNISLSVIVNESIDEEKLMKIVTRRLTEALGSLGWATT